MALDLHHQTPAQFAAQFWARLKRAYLNGDKLKFSRMIWWLHGKVTSGDITSNDARLTFNTAYNRSLTVAQWNSFVTNTLTPIKDRYQAMLDQADL